MKELDLAPALTLIKKFEGLRLESYRDPVGIWTIGYGTTKGVTEGLRITKEDAERLLLDDLTKVRLPELTVLLDVVTSNNELCALLSFCYNVGMGALAKSTLLRKLNSGRPREEVANEFLRWNKAGGRILHGLTKRRFAERALFLTPDAPDVSPVDPRLT